MTAGRMLTLIEVAARLGVSPETARQLLERGDLKGYHLGGGQWRVREEVIVVFIQSRRRRADGLG